ncbi:MAG: glycoside hydrolase family 88 protein [Oscillospiraceae bacterium]|nr:glycoside hydrolase family 88 protein [Oscillospiraceae bacterium]
MKELKRILSLVLCCAMLVGIVPFNSFAFAAETEDTVLTEAIEKAKDYIDGITLENTANDPGTVVSNFGTHFTWDNEKRESSKSYLFDWSYYNGVVFEGLKYVFDVTGETPYRAYVLEYLSSMIAEDGTWAKCVNNTAKEAAGYNATHGADCYKTASLLLDAYAMTADQRYLTIAKVLYDDLTAAESNYLLPYAGNNFRHTWASDSNPDLWLDGLYMILPFRAEYAKFSNDTAELDQIVSRMQWVSDNMYDSATGLFYHAADNATDNSGTFWLRSIGWYAAAIVDIMDSMEGENLEAMKTQLVKLVDGMAACQNESNGMWLNNMAASESSANPYETSGTALVCYAVLKAVNEGWLEESYADMALLAFEGICDEKLVDGNLKDICFKGAPGSSNSTFYDNEGKGLGPFIMLYAEVLEYVKNQQTETPDPTDPDPTEPEETEPVETEPEVTEPEVTEPEIPDQTVTDGVGVSATVSGVSATLAGALLTEEDKALLDEKDYVNYIALDVAGVVAQGETALVTFAIPAHWTSGRVVGIHVEDGTVVEIPGVLRDGKFSFAVSHFSPVGIAEITVPFVSGEGNLVSGVEMLGDAATTVKSGTYYYLYNTKANKTLTGTASSGKRLALNGAAELSNVSRWYITSAGNNTYYVRYGGPNGQYLTLGNDTAALTDTPTAITLNYVAGVSSWEIGLNSQYLNDYNGSHNEASGWQNGAAGDDGSRWRFYPVNMVTTYYELDTNGIEAGKKYLIVNTGNSGEGHALTNNNNNPGDTTVSISSDKIIVVGDASKIAWVFSGATSGNINNGNRYVNLNNSSILNASSLNLTFNNQGNGEYRISYTTGNWFNRTTYYLRYNNGNWSRDTTVRSVYLYEEKTASGNGEAVTFTVTPGNVTVDRMNATTQQLTGTVTVGGTPVELSKCNITWSSSNPSFATVDANGLVESLKKGAVDITATLTAVDGTNLVEPIVLTIPVEFTADITAEGGEKNLATGSTVTLKPTVWINAVSDPGWSRTLINWTSNDPSIVTVDANGNITGVKAGTATVTATLTHVDGYDIPTDDQIPVTFHITVTDKKVIGIRLLQTMATVEVGTPMDTPIAKYVLVYEDRSESDPMDITIDMLSSSDPNVEISTAEPAEFRELEVTYGEEFTAKELFDLVVVAPPDMNYPEYPNPGSVDVNKVISDYSKFHSQGIVGIDLSTSGLPVPGGIDVILVADISNSMNWVPNTTGTTDATKYTPVDATGDKWDVMQDSVAVFIDSMLWSKDSGNTVSFVTFGGYDADRNANSGAYNYFDSVQTVFHGETDADKAIGIINNIDIYGEQNSNGGVNYYVTGYPGMTGAKAAQGGTNYDYAFLETASAIKALKADYEAENGISYDKSGREIHIIFLTDGAPDHYNQLYYKYRDTGAFDYYALYKNANDDSPYYFDQEGVTVPTYMDMVQNTTGGYYMPSTTNASVTQTNWVTWIQSDSLYAAEQVYQTPGVKAITTIGFDLDNGGFGNFTFNSETDIAAISSVLHNLAGKDSCDVILTENERELQSFYSSMAASLKEAAKEAYFVDQMGDKFTLQMTPIPDVMDDPNVSIKSFSVYKKSDVGKTIDGVEVTESMVGMRYGNPKSVETVRFTSPTAATSDQKEDANIIVEGVIYAKNFWYNTNRTPVMIDTDGDGITDFELEGETFRWNIGTINDQEFVLTYYAYLEGSMEGTAAAGTYMTNNYATLYYKNWLGNDAQQSVPSPSVAWESAAFYYGFYLVDSEGNPVTNRATGETGSFYDAVKVTKKVLYSEMPLNSTGITDLEKLLANDRNVLPEGYALFDSEAAYQVTVRSNGGGNWVITSSKPVLTTYVTDYRGSEATTENISDSEGTAGVDFTSTTVWFAVIWEPGTLPDTVVIDYGLPVDIDVLYNDMFGTAGTLYGVAGSLPQITYANGNHNLTESDLYSRTWTGQYGTVELNNGKVRYTPNTTEMPGYERFYYEVKYTATVKVNGETFTEDQFYYGTVTVIPATTIYYEDSFLKTESYEWDDSEEWVLDESNSLWSTDGAEINGAQSEDRPGFYSLTDANNIYGYDQVNLKMSTYSMGSALKATVDYDHYAKAKFKFFGTGFDVISLTSNMTGTVIVDVYKCSESGRTLYDSFIVDTYYGYKTVTETHAVQYTYTDDGQNASWIRKDLGVPSDDTPETTKPENPQNGDSYIAYEAVQVWVVDPNAKDSLYQVPVMQVENLPYGQYEAEIIALYEPFFDHVEGSDSYDFYLDAIRIYDPANDGASDGSEDTTIEDAYKADGEGWPSYLELRNEIIEAGFFDSNLTDEIIEGIVFIDGDADVGDDQLADYIDYGPNNEVYLNPGQRIAFMLGNVANLANVHIGIKSADGGTCTYTITNIVIGDEVNGEPIYNPNNPGEQIGAFFGAKTDTLSTTTDMYYDLDPWKDAIIVISNTGNRPENGTEGIISLTNIKFTYTQDPKENTGDTVSGPQTGENASGANGIQAVDETQEPELGYVYMTKEAAEATIQILNSPDYHGDSEQIPQPEPEPEPTFKPRFMLVKLSRDWVRVGNRVLVTVLTGPDVENLVVNGQVVTRCTYSRWSRTKTWIIEIPAEAVGTLEISVVAYNADGEWSEPVLRTVTVRDAKVNPGEDRRDWIYH